GQPEELPALERFFDRMYAQRWSDEWIAGEFDADYKDFIFAAILRTLKRRVPPAPRTLLDIGAHAGRFLHLAQADGWTVEGIELNPRTAAFAAKRTGALVHQVNAHALASDGRRFGAVVLTDVLEHIPEPMRLLESIAALVEPGGSIAVKVPNGRAQWIKGRALAAVSAHRVSLADNLVHVNHFSPRSLALALEHAGFSGVTVRTAPPELPQRGLLFSRVAPHQGSLQADGARHRVGGAAAGADDDRVHVVLRKAGARSVGRRRVSAVCVRRDSALDADGGRRRRELRQRRRQPQPDHEGVLPADDHSRRCRALGAGRFSDRGRRPRAADGALRWTRVVDARRARAGRRPHPAARRRRRRISRGRQREIPRRPLHRAVLHAAVDVRDTGDLLGEPRAGEMARVPRAPSDGELHRGVPRRVLRQAARLDRPRS